MAGARDHAMGSGSHTHEQLEVEVELEATTVEQQPPQPSLHDGHHQHNHGADGAATSESPRDCAFECKSGQKWRGMGGSLVYL